MLDYHKSQEEMFMQCDNCMTDEHFQGDFDACIAEAKEAGWKIVPDKDMGFIHYCPECVEEDDDVNLRAVEDFKDDVAQG